MTVLNILLFILFFGFMLFMHEFGHYLVAKLFKIQVEEFGFGYPPRLARLFNIGETVFTLNWIPFGAFVKLSGEEDPDVPGGFSSAPAWKKILVLLAGPTMNLATGVLIFALIFNMIGTPQTDQVMIADVAKNSPAEQAGLAINDLIVSVNGTSITSLDQLSKIIAENKGNEVTIIVNRNSEQLTVQAVPRVDPPPDEGSLGIGMANPMEETSFIQAIPVAFQATGEQMRAFILMPYQLITGQVTGDNARVVGPIGIFTMFNEVREIDTENAAAGKPMARTLTLNFIAIISIAIGLTNLLPIPALDGGRILFILPELLFRKKVPAKYENAVHMIGFMLLLALMFYVTAQDIFNPIQLP